jgi:hypothetical protein
VETETEAMCGKPRSKERGLTGCNHVLRRLQTQPADRPRAWAGLDASRSPRFHPLQPRSFKLHVHILFIIIVIIFIIMSVV